MKTFVRFLYMQQGLPFYRSKTFHRKKIMVMFTAVFLALLFLMGRLVYLMVFCSEYYGQKAQNLHERERDIKAARGKILDANGMVLATNKSVCTISVIHSQIEDEEAVVKALVKELGLSEEAVRKRVEKVSSIERVKTNVPKETGDKIRAYKLAGIKVDEDYKRYYPYDTLASKVLGFTGGDNQGIVGLEVKYDSYLQGTNGKILTLTDARGIEIENAGETRLEPVNGYDLNISMDYNIQLYCEQAAEKTYIKKDAKYVSVIVMNPSNGEIFAMVNYPEFHLNDPFTLTEEVNVPAEKKQDLLNQMWRNQCISDTYEPGSTFKIITAAAALEQGVVKLTDNFYCPGYKLVEDRRIRCAKTTGHGAETFETGIMNSCNPVFIELGERLGVENFYKYFSQFGLLSKTNVDLPGEAATIMHKKENVGPVELATISFGQSFQITPMQLVTTVSSIINGGHRITPHFGVKITGEGGKEVETLRYETKNDICTKETSEKMRYLLERVVSDGSGKNAKIEGFSIGGKTATSQTLPRSDHKYISSFLGFAPADDPKVLVLVVINDPKGTYYGGQIAAPVAKEIMENILPYLAK
jgi:stage V sporulation protein D (sporulation-specific penicillin-binding protein)